MGDFPRRVLVCALALALSLGPGLSPCWAQRVRVGRAAAMPQGARIVVPYQGTLHFKTGPGTFNPTPLLKTSIPTVHGLPTIETGLPAESFTSLTMESSLPVLGTGKLELPETLAEIQIRSGEVSNILEDSQPRSAEDVSGSAGRFFGEGKSIPEAPSGLVAAHHSQDGSVGTGLTPSVPAHDHAHSLVDAADGRGRGPQDADREKAYVRALKWALGLGVICAAVEFVGGMMTGSLALKADAMHLTADLSVTAMALLSIWMTSKPPTLEKTYGYRKMEALTGFVSSIGIGLLAAYTLTEALTRIFQPVAVPGLATIGLAIAGLLSNGISTWLLYKYQHDNLTLKGAFLHAATDALGSVGIIVGSALMIGFGWFILDPIISLFIAALIGRTVWQLGKSSWDILMDGVPSGISAKAVEADLAALPGVALVGRLHIWAIDSNTPAMTVQLSTLPGASPAAVLKAAEDLVKVRHGIEHATIQVAAP